MEEIPKLNSAVDNRDTVSKRYLTAKVLKSYICLSTATIYDLVRRRKIPFIPFGRKIVFDTVAIDKWMQRRMVKSIDSINDMS